MRRFVLQRSEDVSGLSGVGVVAEGVEFTDGICSLRWRPGIAGVAASGLYDNIDAVKAIHGHEGRTKVSYIDQCSPFNSAPSFNAAPAVFPLPA